jgi:hypothetical protein
MTMQDKDIHPKGPRAGAVCGEDAGRYSPLPGQIGSRLSSSRAMHIIKGLEEVKKG